MAPIRIALIGLSASSTTSWAAEAHLPYLLSARGKQHYTIVALLNSSQQAAEAARSTFALSPDVKTYGDPDALAKNPDVDLVVVSTRVDTHVSVVEPSLRAGKAAYVEWPLAENYERAAALAKHLHHGPAYGMVGLQGRVSPVILKVKEVIKSGRIGKVFSSDVRAFGSLARRDGLREGFEYFADRKVGGNPITIAYAHMIDFVHEVLGEFESFQTRMQIQRPELLQIKSDGPSSETLKTDVPDFLAVHGKLAQTEGKAELAGNASLAVTFRSGPAFEDTPAFIWSINCEKGEMLITSPSGPYLQGGSYREPVTIQLHDHATDEVVEIHWDWQEWQKALPVRARIRAEVYERFASWWESGKGGFGADAWWPTLKDAVVRHAELKEMFEQFDAQGR